MAHSSLRFGIGRFTTEAEIDFVVQHIVNTVNRLRDMRYVSCINYCRVGALLNFSFLTHSPLWEMVQEGIDINTIDWTQSQH
jgi:cysteine desulfurase